MLTFIWANFLAYPLRFAISCDQLNFDLVDTVVMYKAGKVTVGPCDPHAAFYLTPITIVPEDRKHTSH